MKTPFLLSLVACAALAAPRGLEVSTPLEAVTQIDARLGDWLKGKGDRKALLATRAEVEASLKPLTTSPEELKKFADQTMAGMKLGKAPKKFVAAKAFADPIKTDGSMEVIFFEAQGKMACGVLLQPLPDGRLVLEGGPICREAPLDKMMENAKKAYFEKQGTAWVEVQRAAKPQGCESLRKAAKSIYVAEKAYFAEYDEYSKDLAKLGLVAAELGADVNIVLTGKGPTGGFAADVKGEGGTVVITDANPEPSITTPCTGK